MEDESLKAKRPKPVPTLDVPEPRAGKLVDDMQNGDAVTETQWLERRKEQTGWRNGARIRKIDPPK